MFRIVFPERYAVLKGLGKGLERDDGRFGTDGYMHGWRRGFQYKRTMAAIIENTWTWTCERGRKEGRSNSMRTFGEEPTLL